MWACREPMGLARVAGLILGRGLPRSHDCQMEPRRLRGSPTSGGGGPIDTRDGAGRHKSTTLAPDFNRNDDDVLDNTHSARAGARTLSISHL